MAALGWILNLGFAGGGFAEESRITTPGAGDRTFSPTTISRVCDVGVPDSNTGSNRTFTPADD